MNFLSFRLLLTLALASFIFLSIFGLSFSMPMGPDGHMENCPFMSGMTAVCKMSPFEHMSAWQSMFTATVTQSVMSLLLALFAALVIFYFFDKFAYPEIRAPLRRNRADLPHFRHSLQEAFSNGILNPKVY